MSTTTNYAKPNPYELAYRAMRVMDSISCGPYPDSCDLGHPCAAHGGDWGLRAIDEGEDHIAAQWTPEHQAAYDSFRERWTQEVER